MGNVQYIEGCFDDLNFGWILKTNVISAIDPPELGYGWGGVGAGGVGGRDVICLLYTSPSPRDLP